MKINIILHLLYSLLFALGILVYPAKILAQTTYVANAYVLDFQNGSPWNNPKSFSFDAVITAIRFKANGIPKGAVLDFCLYFQRTVTPLIKPVIAAGSEIWCSHASRTGNDEIWQGEINLSNTPLYLPKQTGFHCGFGAYNVTDPSTIQYECSISYMIYNPGMARYRSLRLPYVDSPSMSDGSIFPVYYWSVPEFPLIVNGFSFFQSFGGSDQTARTSNICLKWVKEGGALVQQSCAPDQNISPGQNYSNPATVYPVNWNISFYDILTATCNDSRANTDCAIWAFVKIPDSMQSLPDSIIGNFGLVKQSFLNYYCQNNLSSLTHHFFCNGTTTCPDETKIYNCQNNLFYASSFTLTPSPSISPTITKTPSPTPPISSKPGDANSDNKVDGLDYVIWLNNYNTASKSPAFGDFNNNDFVDGIDYVIWLNNYNK